MKYQKMRRDKAVKCIVATLLFCVVTWSMDGIGDRAECEMRERLGRLNRHAYLKAN